MPATVHPIPLDAIDDEALPRDRTGLDPAALSELQASILKSGLRLPVELFPLESDDGPRYGILSGFRRITVFRTLAGLGLTAYTTIPAFLREPADFAAALASMVEENEIRADLSPWERGRIALTARRGGVFPTIEEAVDRLYPHADASKRSRLRTIARLAEDLDGLLAVPETLSLRQLLRIANACRNGFTDMIEAVLAEARPTDAYRQWELLRPILNESEKVGVETPDPVRARGGRPRRMLTPRPGFTIRREMTPDGWILRFTGREATSMLLDRVMDEVERMFAPG